MIVCVDANIIFSDPTLRDPAWTNLANTSGRVQVVVPRIALKEAKARHVESREAFVGELKGLERKARGPARAHVQAAISETRQEIDAYSGWLDARISELGWRVVELPEDTDLDELAGWAIARKRPFDDKGGGFRDALHWVTLRSLLIDGEDEYVLLSNDRKAFADSSGKLHESLLHDAGEYLADGTVALATKVRDVIIPGRYRDVEIDFQLDDALVDYVHEALMSTEISEDLDPEALGFWGVDWLELGDTKQLQLVDVNARRLTDERAIEVKFELLAHALFRAYQVDVDSEGGVIQGSRTEWRRVRLLGTARADTEQNELQSIDMLTIELDPTRYSPGAAIEAGLTPETLERDRSEMEQWLRGGQVRAVTLWDLSH